MQLETPPLRHRMPALFGPAMGPRQVPQGIVVDDAQSHARTSVAAAFRAPASALQALLPERFALRGEPLLVLELSYMREIEWLAGRGYNIAGAKIPVTYSSAGKTTDGMLYLVLWESLADPILTGREELGVPKLYAEIPEPRIFQGREFHRASWFGFNFLEVEISNRRDPLPGEAPPFDAGSGVFQWKYIPKTGTQGGSDVSCVTFTPGANPALQVLRRSRADAKVQFRRASWEDLPTMFHVVNALADLPLTDCVGCVLTESRGMKSLGDTVVLD